MNGRLSGMQVYEYFLQGLIWIGWLGLAVVIGVVLYYGGTTLYDAIKARRVSVSHIKAAFFMAAVYLNDKVARAENAGRHAAQVRKIDATLVDYWHELKEEFEGRPYSLSRVNSVHA